MMSLRFLRARLRVFFRRTKTENEMAEEMRFHLDMRSEDKIADGLPADEARYAAQRKFGNVGLIQERCRDEQNFLGLERLVQDVRYGSRALHKNKGYTIVALMTLALGIGVNTTAFTVLNRLLLRSVPFEDTQRLVNIVAAAPDGSENLLSAGDYFDVFAQSAVFEHVAAYATSWMTSLVEPGQPAVRCDSLGVTVDFFPTMGV